MVPACLVKIAASSKDSENFIFIYLFIYLFITI